ncbi:hypothetical protein [Microbispora hainanensis]|uniref:Uncharacterized protein n=1 Tax=Microbispora hainanensis TaxID=568844 RepID=A0A544YZE5_9ACTN|nr:hypothetical protein [Microbispora hainanensis]TQS22143.1 hypothetical protein FLX08_09165 [Microbispora hainanensis]
MEGVVVLPTHLDWGPEALAYLVGHEDCASRAFWPVMHRSFQRVCAIFKVDGDYFRNAAQTIQDGPLLIGGYSTGHAARTYLDRGVAAQSHCHICLALPVLTGTTPT